VGAAASSPLLHAFGPLVGADALVRDVNTAKAKVAAARHRVQAARLLLEEEQAATVDLERKVATVKGLLPSSSSYSTTSDMVDGASYDSALITNLHVQATAVSNVHQLVNIVLDTTFSQLRHLA
jgi:hypothetical protein